MDKWGFEYKTMIVWDKQDAFDLGSWLPIQTELLLVGTRGLCSPRLDSRMKSGMNFFSIKSTRHSEKPAPKFHELIETLIRN